MQKGEESLVVLLNSPLSLRWVTALKFATTECCAVLCRAVPEQKQHKAAGAVAAVRALATAGHCQGGCRALAEPYLAVQRLGIKLYGKL